MALAGGSGAPVRVIPPRVNPSQIQGEAKNQGPFTVQVPRPTPGRTPVPAQRATTSRLPAQAPKAAPPLTPEQLAMQAVQQSLAPLYSQAKSNEALQQASVEQFTRQLIQAVLGIAPQTQADYSQAIQGQSAMAQAAGNALKAANPNAQMQQELGVIGAPASQDQMVASQLNNAFNGGGAVQMYTGGVLPVNTMSQQEAAALAFDNTLPAVEALRGQDALGQVLGNYQSQINQLAAQQPGLVQKYLSSFTTAQNNQFNQQVKLAQLGLTSRKDNASIAQGNARIGLSAQGQRIQLARLQQQQSQFVTRMQTQIREFNSKQQMAGAKLSMPNSSLSRAEGWLVDGSGQVILRGGKPVVLPGFKLGPQGTPVKIATAASAASGGMTPNERLSFLKGLAKTVRTPQMDANGNEKTDANGKVLYTTQTQYRIPYDQAYTQLRQTGWSDQQARQALNTVYQKGQGGRGWLTNAQQGVLKKKGLPVAGVTSTGEGYLTTQQVAVLRKAKMMPAGSWASANNGTVKVYVIKSTY